MNNSNLLTPRQLAERLKVSEGTLAVWRTNKTYPIPYIKVGSLIRYDLEQIGQWLETRTKNGGQDAR